MRVWLGEPGPTGEAAVALLDDTDQPVAAVTRFLRHLHARGYSPNTVAAYAYDLLHFMTFLQQRGLHYHDFTPPESLAFSSICVPCPADGGRNA